MSKTRLYDIAIVVILIAIIAVVALTAMSAFGDESSGSTSNSSEISKAASSSGESNRKETEVTVDEYREAIVAWNKKSYDRLKTQLDIQSKAISEQDMKKLEKSLETTFQLAKERTKELSKIKPPADFKAMHEEYLNVLKELDLYMDEMGKASKNNDQRKYTELTNKYEECSRSVKIIEERLENALGIKFGPSE